MMHLRLSAFAWLAAAIFLQACKTADSGKEVAADQNPVLFTVADEPVTAKEFLYVYRKNNALRDTTLSRQEDLKSYLELYENFKLKVQEAKDAGLHRQPAFLDELAGYKKQLAKPYLTEQSVLDSLILQAYERMQTEVKASHILINLPQNPSPQDTLKAYQQAQKIREQALAGTDFAQLARKYSGDPSAKENAGSLGYFTALQMVYPFENAAFQTAEGEISEPVRTRFGYHLIKVEDRRPSQGKIQVAHILLRSGDQPEQAKAKADELYRRLQEGEAWESLVRQYSDDRATRDKAGLLPPFGTGSMIPAFEEAAFQLKEEGSYSQPVQTPYGWHIIRLEERIPMPSLEELKPELQARIARDSRSQLSEKALVARLMRENEVQVFDETLEVVREQMATSDQQPDSSLLSKPLLQIEDERYLVRDFLSYLSNGGQQALTAETNISQKFGQWKKERLLAFEEANLENKYEDYRMLVKEYHDGILLFQLMEEKVWAKAMADTAGLKAFFEANRDDYQWKERFEGAIFATASQEVANELKKSLSDSVYLVGSISLPSTNQKEGSLLSGTQRQQLQQFLNHLKTDDQSFLQLALSDTQTALRQRIEYLVQQADLGEDRLRFASTQEGNAQLSLLSKSAEVLEQRFNAKNPLALQVIPGPIERGEEAAITAEIPWKPGLYTVLEDNQVYLVKIERVLPAAPKQLNEVRGQVISDYQKKLENDWVRSLRERYKIELNEDVFAKILEEEGNS